MPATCSFSGCDLIHHSHGFCRIHSNRFTRHGDPAYVTRHEQLAQWIEVHKYHTAKECLFWPYTRAGNGYGYVYHEKVRQGVHEIMCSHRNGARPTPKHEAAHSCGNGHLACVNPEHLSWKTSKENWLDAYKHGAKLKGRRKLSKFDITEIHSLHSASNEEVANIFGIRPRWVAEIRKLAA